MTCLGWSKEKVILILVYWENLYDLLHLNIGTRGIILLKGQDITVTNYFVITLYLSFVLCDGSLIIKLSDPIIIKSKLQDKIEMYFA